MSAEHTPLRRIAPALLAVALVASGALAAPSSADPIADKRAEAAQAAERLDQLEMELSQLDEDYNRARAERSRIEDDISAAQSRVDEAQAKVGDTTDELRTFAVDAYVGGGGQSSADVILRSEGDEVEQRKAYAEAATGSRRDLLDRLAADRADADAEIGRLEQVKGEAQAAEERIEGALTSADAKVSEQEALQSRVEGELSDLVAEEQARRAAEEQARAEAAAAQLAAQEASRPAASPSTAAPARNGRDEVDAAAAAAEPLVPRPTAPARPAPAPSAGAGGAVAAAQSQIGTPYVWAGSTPSGGFDCSGFTMWAWGQGGKSLPHFAAAQQAMARSIPLSDLQPGDLVFYGVSSTHHVALYVGGGQIIHAPGRGRHVRYDSVHYWSAIRGAGRV